MMLCRALIVAATALAGGLGPARAADDPEVLSVLVGQTQITIPVPAGYSAQSNPGVFQRWVEDNVDPGARALAVLIEAGSADAASASTTTVPPRVLVVVTFAKVEHRSFSQAEFDDIAANLRQALANLATTKAPEEVVIDGDGEPSGETGPAPSTVAPPRVPTEIVYQDAQVIAIAPVAALELESLPAALEALRGTVYLRVRDKLLLIAAVVEMPDELALAWLRSAPQSWAQAILAANPPLPGPGEAPSTAGAQPSPAPVEIEHEPIGAEQDAEMSPPLVAALAAVAGLGLAGALGYILLRRRSGTPHAEQPRPVRSAARKGKLLVAIGAIVLIVVLISNFAGRFLEVEPAVGIGFTIALNLAVITGAFLYYRGRQYRAKADALQAPDLQAEAPVVYLRSFKADPTATGQTFNALLLVNVMHGLATLEEQLAAVVQPIGPLVAIGEPHESLPTPGGVRLYESNEAWQQAVTGLLRRGRLVIVRAGDTGGLWWEIERCRELVDPERFLILFLRLRKAQYAAFVQKAKDILGVELPVDARLRRRGGFVAFDREWRPRVLPLRAPFTRIRVYWPLRPLFNHALQPVFEVLRVPWQPSPVAVGRMAILSLAAALVLFAVLFAVAAMVQ